MDSAAYSVRVIAGFTQLSSTSRSVITLGKPVNVPLMCLSSELLDRLEPHDHIYSGDTATARTGSHAGDGSGQWGGVPGVVAGGVPGGWYTGYYPPHDPEAGLTLI